MRKILFVALSFVTILLAGCSNTTDNQILKINPEEWLSQNGISIEESFAKQLDDTQYVKDFENFISYDIFLITEDIPFTSDFSLVVDFDKLSSVQGGLKFNQKKVSKSHALKASDIDFNVKAEQKENFSEPFDLSGSASLLCNDYEMYFNLHSLDVFMGEGNDAAKMYSLLGDLVKDKWIDLEAQTGGVVEIHENDEKLPYIVGNLKNVLKTQNVESSPDFLSSVVELFDMINLYIDLGISTNELKLIDNEISYYELSDGTIQKQFTGTFQGKESVFDLSFIISNKGLEVYLYNIKDYNEDISEYRDGDKEFLFGIKEDKESEYLMKFESIKSQQKVVNLEGKVKYADMVEFSADFVTEPLELVAGQKISGKLSGNITKKSGEGDVLIPELTGDILLLSELLSSL